MCSRCGGNLYVDEAEMVCLMCGRRKFYREMTELEQIRESIMLDRSIDAVVGGRERHTFGRLSGHAGRDGQA